MTSAQGLPESSAHTGMVHFGVDIGGTGIKAAPVDLTTGKLTAERVRILTPHPATPDAVAAVVGEAISHFGWTGPIGAAFPAAVKSGVAMTAANVDKSWIGTDIEHAIGSVTHTRVSAVNDADAAGVAEMAYGAGRGQHGVVIMTTFGTGIGTAVFLHGQLIPNTELGHLEIDGKDAEREASELVRERKGLSWAKWAKRVDRYLKQLEALFWPDLIIIGGGASKRADKFLPLLTLRTTVVPATLENDAGIVGAAIVATGDVTRPGRSPGHAMESAVREVAAPAAPARRPAAKKAAAKRGATKRATTKRATTKRAPTKRAPTKRVSAAAAPVKATAKATTTKATTTKATTAKAPPAKRASSTATKAAATKKAVAAKRAAPAKRAVAAKKASPAKKAVAARKTAPAKKAVTAKRAAPARKTPATTKATPAKQAAAVRKAAVRKAAPAKASTRKAAAKAPAKRTRPRSTGT